MWRVVERKHSWWKKIMILEMWLRIHLSDEKKKNRIHLSIWSCKALRSFLIMRKNLWLGKIRGFHINLLESYSEILSNFSWTNHKQNNLFWKLWSPSTLPFCFSHHHWYESFIWPMRQNSRNRTLLSSLSSKDSKKFSLSFCPCLSQIDRW